MKSTNYIEWESLENIPFAKCDIQEDYINQDIDFYFNDKLVFHDYNHVGFYMKTAVELFRRVENQEAKWMNLNNLWNLRNVIRENHNHGLEVEHLIYGEDYIENDYSTVTPLTEERLNKIIQVIREKDPYASV